MVRNYLLSSLTLLFIAKSVFGTDVSGAQSGTWSPSGNPYQVTGNLWITAEQSLTIQAGVEVRFMGQYRFDIYQNSTLSATGNSEDSILFTAQNTSLPWLFLYFHDSNDNSILQYCIIEYGGSTNTDSGYGAVTLDNCNITMQNCEFRFNHSRWGGGVYSRQSSNPLIQNCNFHNNLVESSGGAIGCANSASANVIGCDIYSNTANYNGGGIYVYSNSNINIKNSLIHNNISTVVTGQYGGGGFYIYSNSGANIDSCWVYNNQTQNGNGGGICLRTSSGTIPTHITRTVICNNSATQEGGGIATLRTTTGEYDTVYINNCDIYANTASVAGGGIRDQLGTGYENKTVVNNSIVWGNTAPNGPQSSGSFRYYYCDVAQAVIGLGNINSNPLFVFPDTLNFNLQSTSPCIDAGNPNPIYNDPDGTRCDMGAFYYPQTISLNFFPDTVYFDTTAVGEIDTSEFYASNVFSLSILVDSITCMGEGFSVLSNSFTVPPLDTTTITVIFTPPGGGEFSGSAMIYSLGQADTVILIGWGEGSFYVNPAYLNFGQVILGDTSGLSVWIVNPSLCQIQIDSVISGEPAFSVESNSFLVPPQDSAEVTINFTPYRNGAFNSYVRFYSGNSNYSVTIEGSGYGFFIQQTSLNFGSVGVGFNSTLNANAINLGLFPVSIDSITFNTAVYSAPSQIFTVPAQDTLGIPITFTPLNSGIVNCLAIFYSPVGNDSLTLTGLGVGWDIFPDTLNFGVLQYGVYDTLCFYIANYQQEDFVVDSMHWADPAYIVPNTNFTVTGGDTQAVPVIIHTYVLGPHMCNLMIYTNYGMQQVRLMAWISFSEVNPQNEAPLTFDFPEPYPNPFNEQINIVFTLQKNEKVALSIWNTLGEEVAVLEAGPLNKGLHSYIWRTEGITSGIYFIQLKTSEGRMIRKIVLMK